MTTDTSFSPEPTEQALYTAAPAERPTWPAIRKGMAHRCPNCGKGALYEKYLKLRKECSECGEDLSFARADDGPAYMSILVTAHVMGIAQLLVFELWQPAAWVMAVTFSIGVVVMALTLLPRFKGLIVGVQWAKRMHGF